MVSLIVFDLIKNRKITKSSSVALLVFLMAISIQYTFVHNDFSYLDKFTADFSIIFGNLFAYFKGLTIFWENGYLKIVRDLLTVLFLGLFAIGYLKKVRDNFSIYEVFVPVFIIPLIIYSFHYGQFLQGIIPLMFFYGFYFLYTNAWIKQNKIARIGLIAITAVIFISYFARYTVLDYSPIEEGVATKETKELFTFVNENTNQDDVMVFWRPRVLTLFTDRAAAIYHIPETDDHLLEYFKSINANYAIAGPFNPTFAENRPGDIEFIKFLDDYITKYPENFEAAFKNDVFKVYKIKLD
jgi:hypothetical protein